MGVLTDQDFTHVISGYSAAFSIKDAFNIPATNIVKCGDILSIGQQNLAHDYAHWTKARELALAEAWDADADSLFGDKDAFGLFHNFEALGVGGPILIWLDCNLNSQLMAAFLCYIFRSNSWGFGRLNEVVYERAEREIYNGMLVVLNDEELRQRRPVNKVLSSLDVGLYADIWTAFAGSDLEKLISLCANADASKFTMSTLPYLFRRLPSRVNGLNEIEHEVLRHIIDQAPNADKAIGFAMGYDETPDMVGDLYLFARLKRFGAVGMKHPLIEIDNPTGSMGDCKVRILPLAHRILSGEANMIELNGLDDWIGGVHLTPDNMVYREDISINGN